MVDLLTTSTVSKYLEFRATAAILQCSDGQLGQVTIHHHQYIMHLRHAPFNRYPAHELICSPPKRCRYSTKER